MLRLYSLVVGVGLGVDQVGILVAESLAKDQSMHKEQLAHLSSKGQRDSLRQEMNVLLSTYRQRQSVVELQIQEIDKSNVVLNGLERDMLLLKKRYEGAVEDRNNVGTHLIDLNDELCILYERYRQHKDILIEAEKGLQEKDHELRLLRLQSEELQRHYQVARARIPEVDEVRGRLRQLEDELKGERRNTEEISVKLEDPSNTERYRALNGEDPDQEEMAVKIKILEERVDAKREQLLEKGQVLEEVETLTSKLRQQAKAHRDEARLMAESLCALQQKIRGTTKRMLSIVSELSMYQVLCVGDAV